MVHNYVGCIKESFFGWTLLQLRALPLDEHQPNLKGPLGLQFRRIPRDTTTGKWSGHRVRSAGLMLKPNIYPPGRPALQAYEPEGKSLI